MRGRRRVPGVLGDDRAAARAQPLAQRAVAGDSGQRRAQRRAVAGRDEQRAVAVGKEAAQDVEVGRHHRQLGRERLERHEAEALLDRRERERVGGAEQALDLLGLLGT